jgi:hypothetical protein
VKSFVRLYPDVLMAVDVDAVAALLQRSRLAHARYRAAKPRMVPQPGGMVATPGNPMQAVAALQDAFQARWDADAMDPDHEAPSWEMEAQHDELMAFYADEQVKRGVKDDSGYGGHS